VDLSGADMAGFNSNRTNMNGANLSGVSNYSQTYWGDALSGTAWWLARAIDPPMLEFLDKNFPYTEGADYGVVRTSQDDYQRSIERLRKRL
jgi:uncharacterized protein YjbI with pentapeptide repeats